jgi:sugar lactone lactonase YvrE
MNANKKILAWMVYAPLVFGQTWIDDYVLEAGAMNKACVAKAYPACRDHLQRLDELLDGRVDIVYRLARAEAMLGNKDAALAALAVYSKSGLTFADPASAPEFAGLKDGPEFKAVLDRFKAAKQPVSASTLFLTLPQPDLVAEDIAYDRVTEKFYVSSVHHSKILSIDKHGASSEFVHEASPIFALGVDSKRRILWASTAGAGRSALLKYSLDTNALLKRYDLKNDTKHALGDMTVSAAGDVYVSDGEGGAVYWVDHRKDTLDILVPTGVFHSPQTPALCADGRRLFVPDYSRGIGIVDLATRQVTLLRHPKELSLGGIDGMYLEGRTLIAIQNGTVPERLIRMTLDASLTRVVQWKTIEANWPGLGDPTHGVVVGEQFYFIANSGWDHMADDGSVKPGATFEPATIRQMSISPQK